MPFDDEEDAKKINKLGVNNTPKRKLENKYLELSLLAMAEVEEQLLNGEKTDERYKSATYILNKCADIFKAKDLKQIERNKLKGKKSPQGKGKALKSVPVLNFKKKS